MPKVKGNPDYALGGKLNPFASVVERDVISPAGVALRECYMVNPFVSIAVGVYGTVKFIDNGTSWRLAPEQVLADFRNFDGSPILDVSAAALTVGVISELWVSPVLPNWMFDSMVTLFTETGRRDPSNTSNARMFITIKATPISDSIFNVMLGNNSAVDSAFRGCSGLGNTARCLNGLLVGFEGSLQSTIAAQNMTVGSYVEGQTRARIAFVPGATTNLIRSQYITIKSGVC